jgi:hypothetical protein
MPQYWDIHADTSANYTKIDAMNFLAHILRNSLTKKNNNAPLVIPEVGSENAQM